jgi:parallel beta-helix repeat protein
MNAPFLSRPICAAIFSSLLAAAASAQGPLTPPGAPVPTMKSLSQIDARVATAGERIPVNNTTCPGDANTQYVIAQSGSYFLTGDVNVGASIDGIRIDASNVTLDLNGYEVAGPTVAGFSGVTAKGQYVTVRNGRAARWQNGFLAIGAYATFERLIATSNSGTGFYASTGTTRFDSCTAIYNGNSFYAGDASQFVSCSSSNCSFRGFEMSGGSTAVGCTSLFDGEGFVLNGPGDVVRDCAVSQFGSSGFNVISSAGGSALYNCGVSTNSTGPATGFRVAGPSTLVVDCSARYSGDSSGGLAYGFDGGGAVGAMFIRCSATGWSGAGFSMDASTMVSGCNAVGNSGDGIVFTAGCAVTGNTVSQNGGEGLSGTGVDNRIDGNTSTNNNTSGVRSYDNSNVIVRNVARNNGVDYNPPTSVNLGPTGQSPAGATTSPWANF